MVHLTKIAMLIHNPHHFRLIGIQRCIDKLTRTEKTEGEYRSRLYGFDEEIPVGISRGECRIDFAPIQRELEELYGDES